MKVVWKGASGYNPLVGQVETGKEYTVNKDIYTKLLELGLIESPKKKVK